MINLENFHSPEDVRKLKKDELPVLCDQLRRTMIDTVSANGGHLASNLGTVELTVAMHRVFRFPQDTVVWDVGHQSYAHKLLTGRAADFHTLRQLDGISGFPKPSESEYDSFITGHSSTAISAANGIAKAKALSGDESYTIAVIGDGAMTGGLAYEGLSNAGRSEDKLLVILNDNKMSIGENVGFVARYLSHLRTKVRYVRWKRTVGGIVCKLPLVGKRLYVLIERIKRRARRSLSTMNSYFDNMGFYYLGPVDGHDIDDMVQAMQAARSVGRPVILHVATVKGKGYPEAEKNPDIFHGVGVFDPRTGQAGASSASFSSVFGESLCELARQDERIAAITAAMKKGTCLDAFARQFPDRFFDAGIAEGHAVTFASGMAVGGLLPVFAVYSTFLQRGFDQLLNDTSIMNNHIVLAIDRAGVVPDDGETHQGIYDVPMLRAIPHTTVYAPSNFKELQVHLRQALYDTDGIAAVRYPKGAEPTALADYEPTYQTYDYDDCGERRTLVVTYGRVFGDVTVLSRRYREEGAPFSVLKLNRIHPLDEQVIAIARQYDTVLFVEEAARSGGVGEYLGTRLLQDGYSGHYAVRAIDVTLGACTTAQGLHITGLDAEGIDRFIREHTVTDDE